MGVMLKSLVVLAEVGKGYDGLLDWEGNVADDPAPVVGTVAHDANKLFYAVQGHDAHPADPLHIHGTVGML
jgi:hypothetical protein